MSRRIRQKNKSEIEFLKGEVKRLTAVNKRLRRENKDLRKRDHLNEALINGALEATDGDIDIDICDKCGKGNTTVLDLKHVKYLICDLCNRRERI